MKKICSVLLVLIFIVSLAGCKSKEGISPDAGSQKETTMASTTQKPVTESTAAPEEKVKLRIYAQYSSDDEKQPYDYAAEKMKTQMPNVELELEIMAQDDNQKIKTYAATNNLPDIFVATTDIIESFKNSNNILLLDPYVQELKIEDRFLQSSLSLLKDDEGHTWAIPNAGQFAALLYYNKEVFAKSGIEVPQNYEQFLAAVEKLKSDGIIPLALFAKEKWPGVQLFDILATRLEPEGIKKLDRGVGKASEPAYKAAAEKMVELVQAGLLPKGAFNMSSDDASALFKEGKAAMYLSGAWSMKNLGSTMGDNVGILYYPLADAKDEENAKWNMSGGGYNSGFGVSANSQHKDIAARYTCLFSMEFAEGRIIKRGDPNPILKNSPAPESGYLPIQQEYVNNSVNFKTMTCYTWGLKNSKFKAGLEDEVNRLLTGTYAVDEFIAKMDKIIEQAQ